MKVFRVYMVGFVTVVLFFVVFYLVGGLGGSIGLPNYQDNVSCRLLCGFCIVFGVAVVMLIFYVLGVIVIGGLLPLLSVRFDRWYEDMEE